MYHRTIWFSAIHRNMAEIVNLIFILFVFKTLLGTLKGFMFCKTSLKQIQKDHIHHILYLHCSVKLKASLFISLLALQHTNLNIKSEKTKLIRKK